MTGKPIDKTVFALAVVTSLLVSIPLILFSNSIGPGIVELYDWTAFSTGLVSNGPITMKRRPLALSLSQLKQFGGRRAMACFTGASALGVFTAFPR